MRISACNILKGFEGHFGALLVSYVSLSIPHCFSNPFIFFQGDPSSALLTEAPTQARQDFWFSRTSLPFDPFKGMKSMTSRIIFCPKCNSPIHVGKHLSFHCERGFPKLNFKSSELMTALGTGYFQQRFTTTCTKGTCTFGEVTKEKLAMRKLANDVSKKVEATASSHLAYVLIGGSYTRGIS